MESIGNKEILNNYKIGFLCSRKVPSNIILKTYDWAIAQREKDTCVVSGFHSKIEKDVFHYLVKGTQPIIIVLARNIYMSPPKLLKKELEAGRLLIISPFNKMVGRVNSGLCKVRNKCIVEISDELFLPYILKGGNLERISDYANELNKTVLTIS